MTDDQLAFNPPPGWPKPPDGWAPPKGWSPDPAWPDPPEGWQLWLPVGSSSNEVSDPSRGGEMVPAEPTGAGISLSADVDRRTALLEAENAALRAQLEAISSAIDVVVLDDERVLQEVGIYRYHHPLENAAAYKDRLDELSARIADVVKTNGAIEMSNMFTFDNSLAKGRKMTRDLGKLMLRAYNAEVDNSLRSLRAGNVMTAKKRVDASREAIRKLGAMMQMHISDAFHALRLEEIELTADYLMKKQEEREATIEERARLREERRVAAELAEERARLDKERSHLLNAMEALRSSGSTDAELERRLTELDEAIAQNDYRAANIRAGYVYVISNRGAFGENVVKIGLTRRLEPLDRVNELGGASVPFRFDVHALFFSEDAVTIETELHQHFSARRLNHANPRKEFFFASPGEVRGALVSKVGNLLEFVEHPESLEYLQSFRYWPDRQKEVQSARFEETVSSEYLAAEVTDNMREDDGDG
ncbi:MAG: DUF4041 domain-containing protein [Thermoleophilia bacterium]|nr:DUF4041 domain-containing protein [Thermoleophilia bacterium]